MAIPSFKNPLVIPNIPDIPIGITYLGTPIFSSLIFGAVKVLDNPDTPAAEAEIIPQIDLITVLLSINKRKNVVMTEVQGRVGTVKEYISDGDYQIRVSGALVEPTGISAPRNEAILLDRHLSLGQSLEVSGKFLDLFNINSVVILDYDIAEIIGMRGQFNFTINMISDTPIELEVQREETSQ